MKKVKKSKILLEAAVIIIISLALVIPSSAIITSKENIEIHEKTMNISEIEEPIKVGGPIKAPIMKESVSFKTLKSQNMFGADIPVLSDPEYDLQNPAVASTTDAINLCLLFEFAEGAIDNNVGVINSLDGGETFAETFYAFEVEGYNEFPAVDYAGYVISPLYPDEIGNAFRGSSMESDGIIHVFLIDDITLLEETLGGSTIDWSANGFYDFQSNDIACHYNIVGNGSEYYISAFTGSFSDLPPYEDQVQIPFYMVSAPDNMVWCFWFYYTDSSNVVINIDKPKEIVYYAFQWRNDTNQDVILLSSELKFVGEIEPAGWGDGMGEGRKYQVEGSANTMNPAIAADNDNVYLILETDHAGNQDLVCYHSSDGGDSYEMSTIADSSSDEMYPEIYANGKYAICTFSKDNNLYTAITEDGGATWTINDKINDEDGTFVEQKYAASVTNNIVMWTDDREDYTGIYLDKEETFKEPRITIGDISGGIGAKATVKNVGEVPIEGLEWSASADGRVFIGGTNTGTATLAPGESLTVNTGFMLGFGDIDITITADKETKTAKGKLMLFLVTQIK